MCAPLWSLTHVMVLCNTSVDVYLPWRTLRQIGYAKQERKRLECLIPSVISSWFFNCTLLSLHFSSYFRSSSSITRITLLSTLKIFTKVHLACFFRVSKVDVFQDISPPKLCLFLWFFHVAQEHSPTVPYWFRYHNNTARSAYITKFHFMQSPEVLTSFFFKYFPQHIVFIHF
jgi:hypothetical protein